MTKPELVDVVARSTGMRKSDASNAVDAVFTAITEALGNSERVSIAGFGTFGVRTRAARMGRNPRTGERISIPAGAACVFRPGKRTRDAMAG
jgi:DNA-binding protein HU-beta